MTAMDHGLYPSPNNFEPYTQADLDAAQHYIDLAATTGQSVARVEGVTDQVRAFDYDAPLPDMPDYRSRSWEPAARRYRDLTEEEKAEP